MASLQLILKVKSMQNKWINVSIDDKNITGKELMERFNVHNSETFNNEYTIINRVTFKKLNKNQTVKSQIRHNSEWEIIPTPMSSCGGGKCEFVENIVPNNGQNRQKEKEYNKLTDNQNQ
eukprot:177821_1